MRKSRPPRVHWVVLSACGLGLLLGFSLVSLATRPTAANASRLVFAALVGALLAVARLLKDLADPYGGSFSLSRANAAAAILTPTRRCVAEALARAAAH